MAHWYVPHGSAHQGNQARMKVALGKRRRPAKKLPPPGDAAPEPVSDKAPPKKKKAAKRKTHQKAKRLTSHEASSPPSKKRATRKKKSVKQIHRDKKPTEPEEPASEAAVGRKMTDAKAHRVGRRKAYASEAAPLLEHPKTSGARGQFTPAVAATVVKLVQDGCAQSYAASIAGVSPRSLQYWLRRGRTLRDDRAAWCIRIEDGDDLADIEEDMGPLKAPDIYSEFAHAYDRAASESVTNVFQCIVDRANARGPEGFVRGGSESQGNGGGSVSTRHGTIECAMWILERTDNRMFGKGATRPREDDERDETGRKVDPIADLLEHVNKALGLAPSDKPGLSETDSDNPDNPGQGDEG